MLTNSIRTVRAAIASLKQKLAAYLENERTREISQAENDETGCILFLVVLVFVIAGLTQR